MTEALWVSNALLWIAVLALAGLVLVLIRQIGLLHERISPAGALAAQRGPQVGQAAPQLELTDLSGVPVAIGGDSGERTLLFFLSPSCPICDTLLPTLRRVARQEAPGLRLVIASDGDVEEHRRFRREKKLEDIPYVLSTELGLAFAVAKLPTAVLIDQAGVLRAQGMVNTREHLESLFNAEEMGVASIQEYLQREAAESTTPLPLADSAEGFRNAATRRAKP